MTSGSDNEHVASINQVIRTLRDTGIDMQTTKETARRLAVNVVEC